jgi:hypothetical protein
MTRRGGGRVFFDGPRAPGGFLTPIGQAAVFSGVGPSHSPL